MRTRTWWIAGVLVLCASIGVLLALAIVGPRTHDGPGADFYRCWGWYEGTYGGREGAACPDWWPNGHP